MKWSKAQVQLLLSGLFLVLFLFALQSQAIDRYVSSVKGIPVNGQNREEWMGKLQELKAKHEIAPIDARIDPVWKAIPGYNGITLNIEKSLDKLEDAGRFDHSLVVFEEVEPKVKLADLNPSPIYRGNPDKPVVSFMINVAWGNEYLPEILRTLEKYNVKSTFFLDGSWVSKFPEEARKIKQAGHEIGNHAFSHPDMKTISLNRIRLEISKTNEVIQKELDVKPTLFAPPSGSFDERTVQMAAQDGMYTILWTLDTVDWRKPAPSEIIQRLTPKLDNGGLILMHPTESSMKALPALLESAQSKGLKVGTVSELISSGRVYPIEVKR
ncbi:polysaccharide deacetylase family protein [Ammoniphilus sp. CFH 90114]|uniref:polysaccharide deacetylase family protein n=1 Tax=Ammoniphilus sp. CFH 90114 TaxID=2493665 RepID=UPI0013E95B7F|nr:polysaccharide deacetylase family protein [Ammoniphilus sp. CFH 90114]